MILERNLIWIHLRFLRSFEVRDLLRFVGDYSRMFKIQGGSRFIFI